MLKKIREKLAGKTANPESYQAKIYSLSDDTGSERHNSEIKESLSKIATKLGSKKAQETDFAISRYSDTELRTGLAKYVSGLTERGTKGQEGKNITRTNKNLSDISTQQKINSMKLNAQSVGYLAEHLPLAEFRKAVLVIDRYSDNPSAARSVGLGIANTNSGILDKRTRDKVFRNLQSPYVVQTIKGASPGKTFELVQKYVNEAKQR